MTKFLTVTSLMLFWAFYEMSGGSDFEPAKDVETDVVASAEPFTFEETYRPFNSPVILNAQGETRLSKSEADAEATLMQASFTDAGSLETGLTGEAAVIRTVAPIGNAAEAAAPQQRADIRIIAGDWVNMRQGPTTDASVVGTYPQGTEAEILQITDNDWAEIKLLETGETGWMAAWLLSD